jgi:GTP-binding protein HflX
VPRLRVFNKIDCVGEPAEQVRREKALGPQYPECIVMSARREEDVAKLHAAIQAFFEKGLIEAELFLPWAAQQLRGEIFANCKVLEERSEAEGAYFRVLGEPDTVKGLREQFSQTS